MNFSLTAMKEEHLDQVVEIERASFPAPWSRQAFVEELSNGFAYYIVCVTVDNRVAGYGGMWLVFDEAQITNVAVSPEARGNNIGKTMMLCLIGKATMSGCRKMILEVRQSNMVARHLYESLGFIPGALRKKYYAESGEDAIVMWREGWCE